MITAVDYAPPRWLRNPHLQSALSASELRRRRALRRLHALGAVSEAHIFDGGDGIRLQGWHTRLPGMSVRGLALLLHGWEGSAESSYMRATAASLLEAGYEVVRLNFRDHGDTHHLNEGIFHSCRIAEVVNATADIARRFPHERMVAAGYSLGGNFALRLALRAPQAGIQLDRVAAVCPVLDPSLTMASMETEHPLYCWYFRRKWRDSLRRKRALFPRSHDFSERDLGLGMRELTRWMVERYTDFGTLENYFEGYSIAGERLLPLQVPAHIPMAKDDPVIPFTPFGQWQLPERATLEVAGWGGHCGFIENAAGDGYSERWVAQRLARQD